MGGVCVWHGWLTELWQWGAWLTAKTAAGGGGTPTVLHPAGSPWSPKSREGGRTQWNVRRCHRRWLPLALRLLASSADWAGPQEEREEGVGGGSRRYKFTSPKRETAKRPANQKQQNRWPPSQPLHSSESIETQECQPIHKQTIISWRSIHILRCFFFSNSTPATEWLPACRLGASADLATTVPTYTEQQQQQNAVAWLGRNFLAATPEANFLSSSAEKTASVAAAAYV
jgi:hypothetical protein